MFSSLSLCFSVIAFDLFLLLVVGVRFTKVQTQRKTWCYFIYATGLPLLLGIIVAGNEGYGDNPTLSWCFIKNDPAWIEWLTFWGPVCVTILFSTCCILALFWTLYKSSRATGNDKKAGAWKQYLRPTIFLIEFLCVFVFICSYKFNGRVFMTPYAESMTAFVQCLLGPNGSTATCGTHSTLRPSTGLWYTIHLGIAGQGIFHWFVYGTQRNNYQLWFNFCFAGLGFSQTGSKAGGDESDLGSTASRRHLERSATGVELKRMPSNGGAASTTTNPNGSSRDLRSSGGSSRDIHQKRGSSQRDLRRQDSDISSAAPKKKIGRVGAVGSSATMSPSAFAAVGVGVSPGAGVGSLESPSVRATVGTISAMATTGSGGAAFGDLRRLSSFIGGIPPNANSSAANTTPTFASTSPTVTAMATPRSPVSGIAAPTGGVQVDEIHLVESPLVRAASVASPHQLDALAREVSPSSVSGGLGSPSGSPSRPPLSPAQSLQRITSRPSIVASGRPSLTVTPNSSAESSRIHRQPLADQDATMMSDYPFTFPNAQPPPPETPIPETPTAEDDFSNH